uniref:Uncharacterized protein n=1 Tax=Candidatus Kentrum sp. DK TaxID=2126562 RepID=A0A450SCN4_9GAMM|nr:MAG: hypothetical protein BECKDK2373C_GA0170839_102812 [Candidatus Kentron sp. DK]
MDIGNVGPSGFVLGFAPLTPTYPGWRTGFGNRNLVRPDLNRAATLSRSHAPCGQEPLPGSSRFRTADPACPGEVLGARRNVITGAHGNDDKGGGFGVRSIIPKMP